MTSSPCEGRRARVAGDPGARAGLGSRARIAGWLSDHIGTVRMSAAAVAAWTAAGTAGTGPVADAWWLAAFATLLAAGGIALLVRPVRSGHAGKGLAGGVAMVAGLAGTLAAVSAHVDAGSPPVETAEVTLVSDSHETASGRFRAVATGEFGRARLIADSPLPAAGTRARARLDWWGADLAGAEHVETLAEPGTAWRVRAGVRAGLTRASVGGHEGADLLPGLVIGDVSRVAPELEEAMRAVSLTHLTAVSGANIVIVAGVVLITAAFVWTQWWKRLLPAALVTAGYVFVVGPEPSVTRATGMAALVAVGLLRPVGTRSPAILASALALLLICMPHLAREIGFALSAAATAGLVTLAPRLTAALVDRRVPRILASALAVPTAAQLACTPLLVVLTPQLSAWAIPANLAAAPAVAPATVVGLLAMAAEALGLGTPARALGGLGALCAWWVVCVAHLFHDLPGAVLAWPTPPGGVVLAALFAMLLVLAGLVRGPARAASAAAACGLVVGGLLTPVAEAPGRGDWSLLVCDVGQGSAALVRSAADAADHALLVDTGDDPAALEACLRGTGIGRLTIVLSHFDRDHVGALGAAVGAARVAGLVYPAALAATPEAAEARTEVSGDRADTAGDPAVLETVTGDELPAALLPDGVRATALWPGPRAVASADGNSASLVLLVETDGISVLLPGDIGEAQSIMLAPELSAREPVDVMLAPHHGSGDMSAVLHRAAGPALGVVSVGADNAYGHPTRAALEAFGRAPVARTDLCGTVTVTRDLGVRTQEARCLTSAGLSG